MTTQPKDDPMVLLRDIKGLLERIADGVAPIKKWPIAPKPEPTPNPDGWIPWHGGECPVDGETLVDVRTDDKCEYLKRRPSEQRWTRERRPSDIAYYRPHKPAEPKPAWPSDEVVKRACSAYYAAPAGHKESMRAALIAAKEPT